MAERSTGATGHQFRAPQALLRQAVQPRCLAFTACVAPKHSKSARPAPAEAPSCRPAFIPMDGVSQRSRGAGVELETALPERTRHTARSPCRRRTRPRHPRLAWAMQCNILYWRYGPLGRRERSSPNTAVSNYPAGEETPRRQITAG
jgi:hypothetical protein